MPVKFETAAIKNTIDFVEKTKDLVLKDGEMQVSFDVESLYPNVPIDIALQLLSLQPISRLIGIFSQSLKEYKIT